MEESFVLELFKAVVSEEIENDVEIYKNNIVVSIGKNKVKISANKICAK